MTQPLELSKYSFGVGDRFAHQAQAQLRAWLLGVENGVKIVPVWNKSHREHKIVGSEPGSVRRSADEAVMALGWESPYHVDADHINIGTVDGYLESSDFYTIDVADWIGKPTETGAVEAFVSRHPELIGRIEIQGIEAPFETSRESVSNVVSKYLAATREAREILRYIEGRKGKGTFIPEVSMDETDSPQTPPELLIILVLLADERVPIQTIAPKSTGRFNKGVDYVGDVVQFEKEFRDDLAVIAYAVERYELPKNLKPSVHSGSDKFSIYNPIRCVLADMGAGVHLKTAGTTWLEELIGLAEAGGEGLALAKEIYAEAYVQQNALCAPYAAVIDIDPEKLPKPVDVAEWTSLEYMAALRHEPSCVNYNPSLRQLLHVGYKVAAQMGDRYYRMLTECEETIAKNVTENLYERHIRPMFIGV